MDLIKSEKYDFVKILPYIISILFLVLLFVTYVKYPFLSVDEGFTRGFLSFSFGEMIKLTAMDVHPPLYYLITMAFVQFCQAIGLNFDLTHLMKFPSIIVYLIILVFSLTKLRKDYGLLMGGLFSLTLIVASDFFIQYLTARMYAWAMLFLIISFFYVKDILEKNDMKSWILFTIFSVLGAYTHYFTGVSSVIIYIMLFVMILVNREHDLIGNLKKFFISVVFGIILYIPWLFVLIEQMQSVKGNYWVEPITLSNILDLFSYCLTYSHNQIIIIASFVVIVLIIAALIKKLAETKEGEDLYLVMGVLVFVGTVVFGWLLSEFYQPILVDRYLIPSIGVFWLAISIKISKMELKQTAVLLIIVMITLVGAFNVYHEVQDIQKMNDKTIKEAKVLEKVNNKNSIVVYDTDNHYIRTHLSLDNVSKAYGNITIGKFHKNLTYKFDDVDYNLFVVPDDVSKNPDKDVYVMRFYTLNLTFPNDVNATKIGTAQHADFYKVKMK
jgi:hypothetical protein